MSILNNNKGIALITSLLFALLCLGFIMAMLTIVTQGTRASGASKSYKTAIEAGYGAIDVISRDILPAKFVGTFDSAYKADLSTAISLAFPSESCFEQKVGSSPASWTSCSGQATSPLSTQSPDMTFNLKSTRDPVGYNVYAKITDTRCGGDTAAGQPCSNSDNSGVDYLDTGSGVTASSGAVTPQHRPAYYRIEVQSERAINPKEKAQLSVLYAY